FLFWNRRRVRGRPWELLFRLGGRPAKRRPQGRTRGSQSTTTGRRRSGRASGGDHLHVSFYDPGVVSTMADHRAGQVRTVEEALRFAGISDDPQRRPKNILDVGCGIGGSSRYLVKRYGAKCTAFTISPKEVERAKALTAAEGLADKVSYLVADAHQQPFPDGQFDLVWSMSSAEFMEDKRTFVSELARDIELADWSENVAPMWAATTRNRYTWQGLTSVARRGWTGIKHAYVTSLMVEANNKGLVKFIIITCRKPRTTSQ
ncbi:hypothetical protein Taro_049722, partial [Colocasia esculenta]|nr:hypothetical protein [Colocasia esculenta]